MTIAAIKRAYVRTYGDNGQTVAYVEWVDSRGNSGRTESPLARVDLGPRHLPRHTFGAHMHALFARAKREGVPMTRERW